MMSLHTQSIVTQKSLGFMESLFSTTLASPAAAKLNLIINYHCFGGGSESPSH